MTMTNASLVARAQNGKVRDDPAAKPARRRFTTEYKAAIVEEYDRSTDPGAKGAILRREGLYTSHIVEWRRAKDAGALAGLAPKHREKRSSAERELMRANKRIERLEGQLANHKQALEIQGKASELLARLLAESADTETPQQP
jgi:transposase-like protein